MQADYVNPFVRAAVATLEEMTRGPVRRMGLTTHLTRHAPGDLTVAAAITGRFNGTVALTLSRSTAVNLAGQIMGPDHAMLPALLRSMTIEMTNLIVRQAADELTEQGIPTNTTMPWAADRGEPIVPASRRFLVTTLQSSAGPVDLMLTLQPSDEPAQELPASEPRPWIPDKGGGVLEIIAEGQVSMFLQPVVSIPRAEVMGYEALLRGPVGSALHRPDALFEAADAAGALDRLERLARRTALRVRQAVPPDMTLFMNIDVRVPVLDLACPLYNFLQNHHQDSHGLVLEITERTVLNRSPDLLISLEEFKAAGGKVALDDVGAGHSGLQAVLAIQPQFMKLDRSLVRHVQHNRWQAAMIQAFVNFAREVGATVVAEGVETVNELMALRDLGVDLVQGFLLARPGPRPVLSLDVLALEVLRSDSSSPTSRPSA